MERRPSYVDYQPRRRQGLLVTMLWVLPAMAGMALSGFFLARYVLPSNALKETKIQRDKLHPVRILSPEESSKLSGDNTSHVWTEGVKPSDMPKEEPSNVPRRRRPAARPPRNSPTSTGAPSYTTTDAPTDNSVDDGGNAPNPDDDNTPPNYNGTNE